jgi:hypothetical protein
MATAITVLDLSSYVYTDATCCIEITLMLFIIHKKILVCTYTVFA